MALRMYFIKKLKSKTWCIRRTLQTSSVLMKNNKKEKIRFQTKSKWKQIEAIPIWRDITLKELADNLGKDINHVLKVINYIDDSSTKYKRSFDVIEDFKLVEEIVKKCGKRVNVVAKPSVDIKEEVTEIQRRRPDEYVNVKKRNPIVTIMGHVDHGKTTLLDYLRESSVVESEFGGITQHIGAFNVSLGNDTITFLDTPGHAAFCSMRNRGAQCTDIVVLVVAADDGVMEQTIESINMAKSAGVPLVVAVNKIDKAKADIDNTKRMLMQHGVQVEDLGGDIQAVAVSALKGTNVNSLIEAILAQAEVLELKTDFSGPVEGVILESYTDVYRGKLSTLLVQCGTLKKGCVMIAGTAWCKVRSMFNDIGDPIQEAIPSTPVQVLGWKDLPSAGDIAIQVNNEKHATEIVKQRNNLDALKKGEKDKEIIDKKAEEHDKQYQEMLQQKRLLRRFRLPRKGPRQKESVEDNTLRLNIIVKGDVDGSVEAILDVIETYSNPLCKLDIVHYGVGPVSQNDSMLAEAFNAHIYAFNTGVLKEVNKSAVRHFNVIYKLVDDIKYEINKLLPAKEVEDIIGEANVLEQFLITEGKSKIPVAGCRCIKGTLKKSALYKLVRSNETLYSGSLNSLRHLKNNVEVVKKDTECGVRLSDPNVLFQPGDTLICFKLNKVPQKIEWNPGF